VNLDARWQCCVGANCHLFLVDMRRRLSASLSRYSTAFARPHSSSGILVIFEAYGKPLQHRYLDFIANRRQVQAYNSGSYSSNSSAARLSTYGPVGLSKNSATEQRYVPRFTNRIEDVSSSARLKFSRLPGMHRLPNATVCGACCAKDDTARSTNVHRCTKLRSGCPRSAARLLSSVLLEVL